MWETGKRNPEFETLDELLSLLDVSYDYLTGKSYSADYHNPTEEDIQQMGILEAEYRYTDLFKLFFALDEYGQNDVESLIRSQLQRCR
jgi:DNA-binding helix-turn-helix protein